jgi:hypothetical protein
VKYEAVVAEITSYQSFLLTLLPNSHITTSSFATLTS